MRIADEHLQELENAELAERMAHNMCEAGEALDMHEALEKVEELASGGHYAELQTWLEWKPQESPVEPPKRQEQAEPAPVVSSRDSGPEMGR